MWTSSAVFLVQTDTRKPALQGIRWSCQLVHPAAMPEVGAAACAALGATALPLGPPVALPAVLPTVVTCMDG